jgi:hypothetical protein
VVRRILWVFPLMVVAVALGPRDAGAQRRVRIAELDAVMRRYWIAAVARDSAGLNRVIVGEQPRVVLGAFVEGSGAVTRADAEAVSSRMHPPMKARGDTVWRTYAVRVGDVPHDWRDYIARFEWRCGRWRVAAISSVESSR